MPEEPRLRIRPVIRQRSRDLRHPLTQAEQILWARLRQRRLDGLKFRRQYPISPYIVDFYCAKARLVVEVDGGVHLEQKAYDQERDRHLQARGLRVLRFTNQDVNHNLEAVLTAILEACQPSGEKGKSHAEARD
jgi:very-short-patch-repair endonuclease